MPGPALGRTPTVLWQFRAGAMIQSSPIVINGG